MALRLQTRAIRLFGGNPAPGIYSGVNQTACRRWYVGADNRTLYNLVADVSVTLPFDVCAPQQGFYAYANGFEAQASGGYREVFVDGDAVHYVSAAGFRNTFSISQNKTLYSFPVLTGNRVLLSARGVISTTTVVLPYARFGFVRITGAVVLAYFIGGSYGSDSFDNQYAIVAQHANGFQTTLFTTVIEGSVPLSSSGTRINLSSNQFGLTFGYDRTYSATGTTRRPCIYGMLGDGGFIREVCLSDTTQGEFFGPSAYCNSLFGDPLETIVFDGYDVIDPRYPYNSSPIFYGYVARGAFINDATTSGVPILGRAGVGNRFLAMEIDNVNSFVDAATLSFNPTDARLLDQPLEFEVLGTRTANDDTLVAVTTASSFKSWSDGFSFGAILVSADPEFQYLFQTVSFFQQGETVLNYTWGI